MLKFWGSHPSTQYASVDGKTISVPETGSHSEGKLKASEMDPATTGPLINKHRLASVTTRLVDGLARYEQKIRAVEQFYLKNLRLNHKFTARVLYRP